MLGTGVAAAAGSSALLAGRRATAEPAADAAKQAKPAEALIRELYATLSEEQKKELVLPYDDGAGNNMQPYRLRTYNNALLGRKIGEKYTKPQQELVRGILKSILSGDATVEEATATAAQEMDEIFSRGG